MFPPELLLLGCFACGAPAAPAPARLIGELSSAVSLPAAPLPSRLMHLGALPSSEGHSWVGIPFSTEADRAFVVRIQLAAAAATARMSLRALSSVEAASFGAQPRALDGDPPGVLLGPCVAGTSVGGWRECQRLDHLPPHDAAILIVVEHPDGAARALEAWEADLPDGRALPGPLLGRLVRRLPGLTTTGVSWRSALAARPSDRYVFPISLPEQPVLSLGMGHEPGAGEGAERFIIRQDGATLFDEVIPPDRRWHDVRLPLSGAVGSKSVLELQTEGTDPGRPTRGAWSAPLVLGASPRPSIVLVTIDAARLDHLSAYGYPQDTTPTLREVCRLGTRFDRATSQAGRTWESVLSLMSGHYPATSGVVQRGRELPPEIPLVSDVLSAQGYETLAGADLALFPPAWLSSFDEAEMVIEPKDGSRIKVGKQVARWAQRLAARPTFLWLHLENAHYPLLPTDPLRFDPGYAGRFRDRFTEAEHLALPHPAALTAPELHHVAALYDSALVDADAEIQSILSELDRAGASERTIVVVTADHGELLDEHDETLEHNALYNEVLHVPLVFAWPGHIAAGARIAARVQLIDLAPTLLALAGVPRPPGLDGRDLSAALLHGASLPDAPAYAELEGAYSQFRGDEHLLYHPHSPPPQVELFDAASDPTEIDDLAATAPARRNAAVEALKREIEDWHRAARSESFSSPGQSALEVLRQAGYVH